MLISEYEYVIVGRIGPKWGWAFSSSHNGPAICSPIFQPRELSIIHPKLRRERQRRSLAGASPALPLPFQRLVVSTRWPRAPLAASSSFPSCPRNSRCLILHSGGGAGAGAGPALVLPAAAPRPAVGGEALSRTTLLSCCRFYQEIYEIICRMNLERTSCWRSFWIWGDDQRHVSLVTLVANI